MKKYLALIITVVILSLTLCLPVFASKKRIITLSDDYKNMHYSGYSYTRVDASMLRFNDGATSLVATSDEIEDGYYDDALTATPDYEAIYTIKLTDKQHKEVKKVDVLNTNLNETLFFITIYFYDGSELYIDFIREDLVEEYHKAINGNTDKYYINFLWPEGNIISVDKEDLLAGSKTKINAFDFDHEYQVYADSLTGSFDAEIGLILKIEDAYYFYSFVNSDIKSLNEFWELDDEKIDVIELSDKDIIEDIKTGEQKRFEDDFGYLYNDKLTETVAKLFFILVFALIPLAIFVVTLILAFKSKKALYKKLLLATSGLSLASLATFIYIAFTLFNK